MHEGRRGTHGQGRFPAGQPSRAGSRYRGLAKLDGATLKAQWRTLYGSAPPRRITRGLLIGAVAYRLQEKTLGGLAPAARRRLLSAAEELAKENAPAPRVLAPGTILLREWHGVNHQVTVLEGSVEYHGQRYRSLSQVARVITGSCWSGPLFFGLRQMVPE
jgi:Protein of unknown function (DUF2924)